MIKKIYKYCMLGALSLGVAACNIDEFGDTNVNPNGTTDPNTLFILVDAIEFMHNTVTPTTGQLYVQYLANSQYTSADNYQTIRFEYSGYYSGPLAGLSKIIELNTDPETASGPALLRNGSNANQIATAQILKQYYFLRMTDRWGDIPYSETFQLEDGILQPKFDSQEDVYNGIFSALETAVNNIDVNDNNFDQEPLFGGDLSEWIKFANTIRMVAALRLSEVNPTKGIAEFAAAYSAGVIDTDIVYPHQALESFDNPWYDRFETRRDWTIAEPFMNRLQTVANGGVLTAAIDPRLPIYADPAEDVEDPSGVFASEYVGMPYGLTEADAGSVENTSVSFLGEKLREQTSPTFIYTLAEVRFAIAEAAERGWLPSVDAETAYYEAIDASMAQWDGVAGGGVIKAPEITAYKSDPWVIYDGSIEQIVTQKWIASFLGGYEMWAEFRRTGFPDLEPAANALTTNKKIPYRQAYTTKERDLNGENYEAALQRQGPDELETRVWWDVD